MNSSIDDIISVLTGEADYNYTEGGNEDDLSFDEDGITIVKDDDHDIVEMYNGIDE